MNKNFISYILLLFFLIEGVISQDKQGQPIQSKQNDNQNPQKNGLPQFKGPKRNPNDESLYKMEKAGKKPKDIKFEENNIPNLNVDVVETKDHDYNQDVITNKSKLKITWTLNNENKSNAINPNKFELKLLKNVTQDSTTNIFYSLDEEVIATNLVQLNEYEYKVPKLDESYVYNIIVIADPVGVSNSNSIGISKTLLYKSYESTTGPNNNNEEKKNGGVNPLVYGIIAVVGLAIFALAFVISKKVSKNDENNENLNSPAQTPTTPSGSDSKMDQGDRISIVTDANSEVSWSNLEIANASHQTKNNSNENVYRTLDKKGYKRDNKQKNDAFVNNEKQFYKVVRIFIPTEEDEIRLDIGDEVEITTIFEDGWCEGINKTTKENGIFPRTCVVEIEQYASLLERSKSTLPSRKRCSQINCNTNENN